MERNKMLNNNNNSSNLLKKVIFKNCKPVLKDGTVVISTTVKELYSAYERRNTTGTLVTFGGQCKLTRSSNELLERACLAAYDCRKANTDEVEVHLTRVTQGVYKLDKCFI
jgi:hypothetical protein